MARGSGEPNAVENAIAEAQQRAKQEQEQIKELGNRYYGAVETIAKAETALSDARSARLDAIGTMVESGWSRKLIGTVCGLSSKSVEEAIRNWRKSQAVPASTAEQSGDAAARSESEAAVQS